MDIAGFPETPLSIYLVILCKKLIYFITDTLYWNKLPFFILLRQPIQITRGTKYFTRAGDFTAFIKMNCLTKLHILSQ